MSIDRAGWPFIAGALVPTVTLLVVGQPAWALVGATLTGAMACFFRDPSRRPPDDPRAVLAPADGRVVHAGPADDDAAPPGRWSQVSIFLSPLDVHVNRTPVGGRVIEVRYRPGRFRPAYDRHAAAENERSEITIDHDGRVIVCRQVVGVLARRVVCRLTPGMTVRPGQRLGIMKFGSRMDVFLPPDASVLVSVGDRVRGGESIVARLMDGEIHRQEES